MITENKGCKIAFTIFSVLCLIAIVVCLICDAAISKGLTWSLISLGGVLFGWVIISPLLLAKKNKVLFSIVALSVAVLPLLFLLEWLAPFKGWFVELAVPLAITGVAAIWVTFFVVRYLKINKWFLSAVIVFVYGVLGKLATQYFINRFLGNDGLSAIINWEMIIQIVFSTVITVLLAVIGYYSQINKRQKESRDENEIER